MIHLPRAIMADECDAINPFRGSTPVPQDNLQATLPEARQIPDNLAVPYLDLDGSGDHGRRHDRSTHNAMGLPSPPIPSLPMDSLHASALATITHTLPPFVAPLEVDLDTGYPQPAFGNEAWISPLDVTGAWQFGALGGEQVTVPVFGQGFSGYELPLSFVDVMDMGALPGNQIIDPGPANGEGTPLSPVEEMRTPSRTSNPNGTSSVGHGLSSRRTSSRTGPTASTTHLASRPGESVLDLGLLRNATATSNHATHTSRTLEFIPYCDARENDSQNDNPSPTDPSSTSAAAFSASAGSSLVSTSPVAPTMTFSELDRLDLYNARARNRVAASRCRIKQKASIAKLKEAEQMLMDERDHLLGLKKHLTDQVCGLKELLFMHARCKEDRLIGEYLELTATQIVDNAREAAGKRRSDVQIGHSSAHSPEPSENSEDDSGVE
ncbi:hypothetical protein V8F20_004146 [Naviculisporaceae sp. PSN 640]